MISERNQTPQSNIPEPLNARQREMLAIKAAGAKFEALKCADISYSAAGVTFVQDGRFTKAIHNTMTVASFVGRFNKESLLATIRSNIADHAKWVGVDIIPVLKSELLLPEGHGFRLDMDHQLDGIKKRGCNMVSGYIGGKPSEENKLQIHAEFQIFLNECRASLIIATGDRLSNGADLLDEGERVVTAETYPELGAKIALVFNQAISRTGGSATVH
jgi:hypothetical protein